MAAKGGGGRVPSLVDLAVDACIQHRHLLGDVGFMEAVHLRRILPHCTRAQLEAIEDMTLECSGRDLTWHTWDSWYLVFRGLFGPPAPHELLQLPGEPPVDYVPPAGDAFKQTVPAADYRSMVLQREAEVEARKAAALQRLRSGYQHTQAQRQGQRVQFTQKAPPPKRARKGTQQLPTNNGRRIAGKPANKVLHTLGLLGSSSNHRKPNSTSSGSISRTLHGSITKQQQQQQRPASTLYRPLSGGGGGGGGSIARSAHGSSSSNGTALSAGLGSSDGIHRGSNSYGLPAAAAPRSGMTTPGTHHHQLSAAQQQRAQEQQRAASLVGHKRSSSDSNVRPLPLSTTAAAAAARGIRTSTAGTGTAAAGVSGAVGAAAPGKVRPASGAAAGAGSRSNALLDRPVHLTGKR